MYIWIELNKEIDRLKRINTMSEDEFIKWQESKNPRNDKRKREALPREALPREDLRRYSNPI